MSSPILATVSILKTILTIDFLSVLAVVLGLLWITVNAYMFYPILGARVLRRPRSEHLTHVVESDLVERPEPPLIDVLIPAYKEEDVVHQAISSVRTAEYPQQYIDLLVLTEPGDTETREALEELAETYRFTTVEVPEEYPGDPNKPRALNVGFEVTAGDIVGIIDAENVVAPDLFAKVSTAIAEEGCDYTQGSVDMVNEHDGWLNTLFRAEYGHWYNHVIPAHFQTSYPIPLSGTTCFFKRAALSEISDRRRQKYGLPWDEAGDEWLANQSPESYRPAEQWYRRPVVSDGSGRTGFGGWIPWNPDNVTEDFELGLFLWEEGYELGLVDSTTTEESPLDVDAWLKQRTRWQKGKLQTFLQYLRQPPEARRAKRHVLMQSILPHLGPINLFGVVIFFVIASAIPWTPSPSAKTLLTIAASFIPLIAIAYGYGYWTASNVPKHTRIARTVVVILTLPVYWLLQWIADMRALKQVYLGDLNWEKTTHLGQDEDSKGADDLTTRLVDTVYRGRLLLPIVALGVFLRTFRLGSRSFWLDEIYSVVYRGQMPVRHILLLTQESHPPLYYVLLHYWTGAFGTAPAAARMLSALFGVGAIVAIYFLARTLFDREAGLIAALLLAVSTLHVHNSRTARMYELLVLLALVSTYFFWRLIRTRSYGTTIWYVVSTWLLVLTHLFAAFVVIAQNVYVATLWLTGRNSENGRPPITLRYWLLIQASTGLLALPWILLLGDRVLRVATGSGEGNIGWIRPPSLSYLRETLLVYFGHPNYYPIMAGTRTTELVSTGVVGLLLLVLLVTAVVARFDPRGAGVDVEVPHVRARYLLVLLFGTSVVVPLVLSYALVPVFVIRNTIVGNVALYLLLAGSLVQLRNERVRYAVVALLVVAAFGTGVTYFHADSEEDWEGVVESIDARADRRDLVILHPAWINTTFAYYSDDEQIEYVSVPRGGTVRIDGRSSHSRGPARAQKDARTGRQIRSPDTIWVVNYAGASVDADPLLSTLHHSKYRAISYRRSGIIEVYVFVNPGSEANSSTTQVGP